MVEEGGYINSSTGYSFSKTGVMKLSPGGKESIMCTMTSYYCWYMKS